MKNYLNKIIKDFNGLRAFLAGFEKNSSWKLELLVASGGGLSGGFVTNKNGVRIEPDRGQEINFSNFRNLKVKARPASDKNKPAGRIDQLNHTILTSYRGRSEGVGEDLLFVKGGDQAGKHKVVTSKEHSQQDKNLWGGKGVGEGVGWFGPREMSREIDSLNQLKEKVKNTTTTETGEKLRKSGSYIDRADGAGVSKYGKNRSLDLEQTVLELYRPLDGWQEEMGIKPDGKHVDFEIDLTGIAKILGKTEEELKRGKGEYGEFLDNKKLKVVRKIGNVEGVAFNYLKLLIGPELKEKLRLKNRNIGKIVGGLMAGEPYGFDCEKGDVSIKTKYFEECKNGQSLPNGVEVKRVMKSSVEGIFGRKLPKKGSGPRGEGQATVSYGEGEKIKTTDNIEASALIDEKCEVNSALSGLLLDLEHKIREETCDLIIRPGFGNLTEDKRLCLIEVPDYQYYLRMQHYFKIMDGITGHNKNAFGTKCSNYGI